MLDPLEALELGVRVLDVLVYEFFQQGLRDEVLTRARAGRPRFSTRISIMGIDKIPRFAREIIANL
jgi:hypothetical protein